MVVGNVVKVGAVVKRDKKIFEMWLACHTQEKIADAVGLEQRSVGQVLEKSAELPESLKPAASHAVDFKMWLACHTQQEIAEAVSASQQTVVNVLKGFTNFGNLAESGKAAASHAVDFDPPLYNVWRFKEKSEGAKPWRVRP